MKKLKVGVFSFACCEGCCISMIESLNDKMFEWKERVEFVNFRALKKISKVVDMDVAFVEGAIGSEKDVAKIGEVRVHAKKVIAVGSGAINGWPSTLRNDFTGEKRERVMKLAKELGQLERVAPASVVINVDDKIEGCPISRKDFIDKMEELFVEYKIGKVRKQRVVKKKAKKKKVAIKKKSVVVKKSAVKKKVSARNAKLVVKKKVRSKGIGSGIMGIMKRIGRVKKND
jgi:coenzyme F420-reducing hydrogenase gamma subunit